MRISVWPRPSQPWNDVLELARHAERTGWDGIWISDHLMPDTPTGAPDPNPMNECLSTLAALAASVPRIRLGTLVVGNTFRHPAVLAKTVATIDQISEGRVVLGLGAGWQRNEHDAYGIEFGDVRWRLDRLEEACAVITSLLRDETTTFAGRHYRVTDAPLAPKPAGPLPLLLGVAGEKISMRIAARYADEWNLWGLPSDVRAKRAVLDAHCAAIGRDPATIRTSAQALVFVGDDEEWLARVRPPTDGPPPPGPPRLVGTPAELQEVIGDYLDAGLDELIVPDFTFGPGPGRLDTFDRLLAEVFAPLGLQASRSR